MPRILKVDQSDYRVRVQPGGFIVLDTGRDIGEVIITGNLRVLGDTTTVDTANLTIEDNIILLNKGEVGFGVPLKPGISDLNRVSGIEIDRGPDDLEQDSQNAQLLFDEKVSHWDPTSTALDKYVPGTFVFQLKSGKLVGIKVASIMANPNTDLTFDLQNSNKSLSIVNAQDYETYLDIRKDPNAIPNLKWVQKYVAAGGLTDGMADVDKIYFRQDGIVKSRIQAYAASLDFFLFERKTATLTESGFDIENVRIKTDTISNTGPNNLILSGTNDNVEIASILNLDDYLKPDPLVTSGTTKLYSKSYLTALTDTPGRTGLFFRNTVSSDELVSKNRALLFSMLF